MININKAALAIFTATLGWVLFVCFDTDFINRGQEDNIFLPHVGHSAEIILFLLATMSIVEVLHSNGCFDFLTSWIRTRNSRLLMWKLTTISFIMSANIDNISSIVLMLTITNTILPRSKDRRIYGSMVLLSVIFGGALTVIGDPTGLLLWNKGAITATDYSLSLLLPCIIAWALPTAFICTKINNRIEIETPTMSYRGDDDRIPVWQRVILFVVGIGGLWFIPTFHNLTTLPPFLGALCVLSLLWIISELINIPFMRNTGRKRSKHLPHPMRYNSYQQILYIIGVILTLGVMEEIGLYDLFNKWIDSISNGIWFVGILTVMISTVLDNFASCALMVSLHDVATEPNTYFSTMGAYWKLISFATQIGGSILGIGSISGAIMMQMQGVTLGWYAKHITPLTVIAGIIAFLLLYITVMNFNF